MARNDYYEDLCKYFEFMLGKIPNRDEFKAALQHTLTEEEIRVIFLLPFIGEVNLCQAGEKSAPDWHRSAAA